MHNKAPTPLQINTLYIQRILKIQVKVGFPYYLLILYNLQSYLPVTRHGKVHLAYIHAIACIFWINVIGGPMIHGRHPRFHFYFQSFYWWPFKHAFSLVYGQLEVVLAYLWLSRIYQTDKV